jgi:hypothetical protein
MPHFTVMEISIITVMVVCQVLVLIKDNRSLPLLDSRMVLLYSGGVITDEVNYGSRL